MYRGRVDSIVSPGAVSGHVHKVSGGSNFGPAGSTQTPLQVCSYCYIKREQEGRKKKKRNDLNIYVCIVTDL